MNITQEELDAACSVIKKFEGCKLTAYQDQVGVWTIGYGCTGPDIVHGVVWDQAHADSQLTTRVRSVLTKIKGELKVAATVHQLAAMASLAYNIGDAAFSHSTVLKDVNAGNTQGAADAFLMWNKAGGKVNNGLENRREAERALFLS